MKITGEQLRMLRGAFRLSVRDLAATAGISKSTVVSIEAGGKPQAATVAKIMAAFSPYVRFVEPVEGVDGPGLILKPGFERAVRSAEPVEASMGQSSMGQACGRSGLAAFADFDLEEWEGDDEADDDEDLEAFERTPDDQAEMLAYWRAWPERWAALHKASRQCLLQAMGVSSL